MYDPHILAASIALFFSLPLLLYVVLPDPPPPSHDDDGGDAHRAVLMFPIL